MMKYLSVVCEFYMYVSLQTSVMGWCTQLRSSVKVCEKCYFLTDILKLCTSLCMVISLFFYGRLSLPRFKCLFSYTVC